MVFKNPYIRLAPRHNKGSNSRIIGDIITWIKPVSVKWCRLRLFIRKYKIRCNPSNFFSAQFYYYYFFYEFFNWAFESKGKTYTKLLLQVYIYISLNVENVLRTINTFKCLVWEILKSECTPSVYKVIGKEL